MIDGRTPALLRTDVARRSGELTPPFTRSAGDPEIGMSREEIEKVLDLREFVGRAPEQVTDFVSEYIQPVLDRHANMLDARSDVRV